MCGWSSVSVPVLSKTTASRHPATAQTSRPSLDQNALIGSNVQEIQHGNRRSFNLMFNPIADLRIAHRAAIQRMGELPRRGATVAAPICRYVASPLPNGGLIEAAAFNITPLEKRPFLTGLLNSAHIPLLLINKVAVRTWSPSPQPAGLPGQHMPVNGGNPADK